MEMAFLILLAVSSSGAAQDVYVTPRLVELETCRRIQRSRSDQQRLIEEFRDLFPRVSRVSVRCQPLSDDQLERLRLSITELEK